MTWDNFFKEIIDPFYGFICFYIDINVNFTNIGVDSSKRGQEKVIIVILYVTISCDMGMRFYKNYKDDVITVWNAVDMFCDNLQALMLAEDGEELTAINAIIERNTLHTY